MLNWNKVNCFLFIFLHYRFTVFVYHLFIVIILSRLTKIEFKILKLQYSQHSLSRLI